jgi:hypothetical protein
LAKTTPGTKIAPHINPQNIYPLWCVLSARKPKIGCNIVDKKLPKLIIILIVANDTISFAAIKGYSGTRQDGYISAIKCPRLNENIAFLSVVVMP